VALVAGLGSVASDDLYRLLLRRLRVFSMIAAVGVGIYFSLTVPTLWNILRSGRITVPEDRLAFHDVVLRGVVFLVSVVTAVLLRRRPASSLRGLRTLELLLVGVFASAMLVHQVIAYEPSLEQPAGEDRRLRNALAGWYISAHSLLWFGLIVWYGATIPNTWRRSATVVSILALSPLALFAVLGLWLRPLPTDLVYAALTEQGFWIGVAAAIAVFSSLRIETLRRQASAARKLGQYVLKEKLGAGGMGEVYRAEHVLLRRPCALKLIRPERAGDPKNLRRFEREVQITATLTHPNTVQIYDYGHAVDGTFYYVMEYLPGTTLEELVKREGPLPPARAIHLLRQICGALQEAHARGLIHRDVKPGNVMVCERGGIPDVAKLLDFGLVLAQGVGQDGDRLTQEGAIAGTPAYVSPEQASGREDLDARSDIYSVGCLAYFLLTGQPPFAGRPAVRMLAAHMYEPPAPPTTHRPDVPVDLEGVVLRCLAKDPTERYPTAQNLESALAGCLLVGRWTEEEAACWWRANPPRPMGADGDG
jgi:serine/threonine-protein kinase